MARRVRVEVDGVSAVAELCEDLSPKTSEAFWQVESRMPPGEARSQRSLPPKRRRSGCSLCRQKCEVAAWEAERNRLRVAIEWCFRVADARRKLAHLYPQKILR